MRSNSDDDNVNRNTFDKAWVMLVACFTTGAYHLELVPDLTADAFLRAFGNFIATRGIPATVRSDNASTFHKGKDMIQEVYERFKKSLIGGDLALQEEFSKLNIKFSNNPPLASHFGGKHERGIKSVRRLMRAAIGTNRLYFADMHASLKYMEMVLNSRPSIRARGVFEEGDFILTPGHLILGRSLNMLSTTRFIFFKEYNFV